MVKKANIVIKLLPEASKASTIQIKEEIKCDAKIPWCKEIEDVSVEDTEASCMNLEKRGVSKKVAKNLLDLYTQ